MGSSPISSMVHDMGRRCQPKPGPSRMAAGMLRTSTQERPQAWEWPGGGIVRVASLPQPAAQACMSVPRRAAV